MIWRLVVLGGVWVCLLPGSSEGGGRGARTVTFHRTQQDESQIQSQVRTRARREASGSSHGLPFTACRLPLTPNEHRILDKNTYEVRWGFFLSETNRKIHYYNAK